MYAIDAGTGLDRDFLFFFLLTDAFTAYAELESMRVAMPKINREALGSFALPKPPQEEQVCIVEHIRVNRARIDVLVDSVNKSLESLFEYRRALISGAVTGLIEVTQ